MLTWLESFLNGQDREMTAKISEDEEMDKERTEGASTKKRMEVG